MAKGKVKKQNTGSKIKIAERKIIDADEAFSFLKALIYGKNGTGKTRFGATAPKPIVVDCNERGTLSIRKFKDVKVFHVETWTEIDTIFWYLQAADHDRKTVVIDTMTSLAQLCMKFVLGDESSRDPSHDPDMPTKREWGKVGELMRTVILNFRNLDMHVIFLAQERRGFSEDEDEAVEVFPEVSPSVRSTLTAAVDIIGRTYVKEVVKKEGKKKVATADFRMLLGPHETYTTKDRSDSGLGRIVRDPNASKMLKKIMEGV